MTKNSIPIMLKISEIPAHFPGLTEHAVRQLVISGAIPSIRVGRKYLVAESVLSEYLLRGNNAPQAEPDGKIRKIKERS